MVSERLINAVYMWVGMVCGGDVFVTYFKCWNEEVFEFFVVKKKIFHDLGPTGLRLEKWVTQPKIVVYV